MSNDYLPQTRRLTTVRFQQSYKFIASHTMQPGSNKLGMTPTFKYVDLKVYNKTSTESWATVQANIQE